MEEINRLPVMFDEKENSTQSPERPAIIRLEIHPSKSWDISSTSQDRQRMNQTRSNWISGSQNRSPAMMSGREYSLCNGSLGYAQLACPRLDGGLFISSRRGWTRDTRRVRQRLCHCANGPKLKNLRTREWKTLRCILSNLALPIIGMKLTKIRQVQKLYFRESKRWVSTEEDKSFTTERQPGLF